MMNDPSRMRWEYNANRDQWRLTEDRVMKEEMQHNPNNWFNEFTEWPTLWRAFVLKQFHIHFHSDEYCEQHVALRCSPTCLSSTDPRRVYILHILLGLCLLSPCLLEHTYLFLSWLVSFIIEGSTCHVSYFRNETRFDWWVMYDPHATEKQSPR